jgi:hypothetical protein
VYSIFFLNIGTITFSNTEDAPMQVSIQKGAVTVSEQTCGTSSCIFRDIPAGTYQYKATSEGKQPIAASFTLRRGDTQSLSLQWEYDVALLPEKEEETKDESLPLSISLNPLRLMQGKTPLFTSKTALGYSTGSLDAGFFLVFEPGNTLTCFEVSKRLPLVLNWTEKEFPLAVKRISPTLLVFRTKSSLLLASTYSEPIALESIPLYDDIDYANSKLIALIKASSVSKKETLNLSKVSGDILLDISKPGTPIVLKNGLSDTAELASR